MSRKEVTTLPDDVTVTRIYEDGKTWSKWNFSDGFKCYTDKRATALAWHRAWLKKNELKAI